MKLKIFLVMMLMYCNMTVYSDDAQECASMMLFGSFEVPEKLESVDLALYEAVISVLNNRLDFEGIEELKEEMSEEWFVKVWRGFLQFNGGPYRYVFGMMNFISSEYGKNKEDVSVLQLQKWESDTLDFQTGKVNYYTDVFDELIMVDPVISSVYKREIDCLFQKIEHAHDVWGLDEKALIAGKTYYEITLKQYFFITRLIKDYYISARNDFENKMHEINITSYDIACMQRFLNSDEYSYFQEVHEECLYECSNIIMQNVTF